MQVFICFSYENTEKSALYTYDVDVCFAAVLAAKLGFPWIYEYFTGRNCKNTLQSSDPANNISCFVVFQTIGLTARSGQEYSYDEYPDYAAEQLQSVPSFSEKASQIFNEMGKAVHRDPSPYSSINRYNRDQKQF